MTDPANEDDAPSWPGNHTPASELADRVVATGIVDSVHGARVVTDGMQHVVLIVDDRLVARFPRNAAAAASLRREVDLLSHLQHHVSAPIPSPVHVDHSVSISPMLHGDMTTRTALGDLSPRHRDRLVDDVARFLSALGTAATSGVPASEATTSRERLEQLRERADRVVRPLLWEHQRRWYDDVFARVGTMSFEHTPTIIHGDLAPYHVLHDADTATLTGVIDFGVAGTGDRAVDVACLLATWGDSLTSRLFDVLAFDDDTVERARLVAAVQPIEWSTIALEHDAPDMAVAHLGHHVAPLLPTRR